MKTILVPVDGSDHALKALHIASDLAEKYGGSVALLHVLSEAKKATDLLALSIAGTFGQKLTTTLRDAARHPDVPLPRSLLMAVGEKILDHAAAKVRRRGIEADVLAMEAGNPADIILIAQKQTGAGTIVMGCRGVSQSTASSFGSISHAVFERADCTCLSVK